MFGSAHNFEVFGAVVVLVAVFVMDAFIFGKAAAKYALHHDAMFTPHLPSAANNFVPVAIPRKSLQAAVIDDGARAGISVSLPALVMHRAEALGVALSPTSAHAANSAHPNCQGDCSRLARALPAFVMKLTESARFMGSIAAVHGTSRSRCNVFFGGSTFPNSLVMHDAKAFRCNRPCAMFDAASFHGKTIT